MYLASIGPQMVRYTLTLDISLVDQSLLSENLSLAHEIVSKDLRALFFDKFHLRTHFEACKKFLLLGQGDFILSLIEVLGPNLSRAASNLYRHNVSGLLESAVRSSCANSYPKHILDRLDVRLLEVSENDVGWDVFCLEYHTDFPMNIIFSHDVMKKYSALFIYLWRFKRAEKSLSNCWRQLGILKKFQQGFVLTYV